MVKKVAVAVPGTLVDEVLDELRAALVALVPELEGLTDYRSLDIEPATRVEVDDAIVDYERRKALLEASIAGLEALLDDGYPALDVREVSQAIYDDLTANAATIAAALAKFASNAATALNPTAGDPEPK